MERQTIFLHYVTKLYKTFPWKQKEEHSQKHSELETALKQSQEEIEAKKKAVSEVESMVKELEHKVQLADAKPKVSHNISAQNSV